MPFFEVSAKNGTGVSDAFLHLGKMILEARYKWRNGELLGKCFIKKEQSEILFQGKGNYAADRFSP